MSVVEVSPLAALREEREEAVRTAQRAADARFVAGVRRFMDQHRASVTGVCYQVGMSRTNMHRLLREHPEVAS